MKKIHWNLIIQAAVLVLSIICLLSALLDNEQAALPIPLPQTFSGEYSLNGGAWQPLTDDAKISALDGDLILRGHLSYDVPEGGRLNFYLNHIGYSLYINGELYMMSTVMYYAEQGHPLTPSTCGEWWSYILSPGITTEDELEIHLHNFHIYGNDGAYRDFLNTLSNGPDSSDILEKYLEPYSRPFEVTGLILLVAAMMLLGAGTIASIKKMPDGRKLWRFGLLTLFVGGFFLLDTIDFSFVKGLLVFNTYGRQLCLMLALFYMGLCSTDALTGARRRVAKTAVLVSGIFDSALILLSLCGAVVIYDTTVYWAVSQFILCPLLLVCCGLELYRGGGRERPTLISGILLFIAAPLDLWGVGESIYSQGTCTKVVFVLLFLLYLAWTLGSVVTNYQAAIRAEKLEKELEDSRIAIMLSQIQPHFIYNTLGTVEHLCTEQPEVASKLVHNFSLYLRGNFSELDNTAPIRLSQEMEHIQHYVDIEHIRFPDMEVRFQLNSGDFLLPALSVQPLVENAIKHGLMGLESGGTVTISSYETDQDYCVSVEDDGVGFDTTVLLDDREHIGIRNIRGRIVAMCGGTLTVESAPGKGTKALITIPKERREHP